MTVSTTYTLGLDSIFKHPESIICPKCENMFDATLDGDIASHDYICIERHGVCCDCHGRCPICDGDEEE